MPRDVDVELVHYLDIRQYSPKVGDIVIKHGWIRRTIWFGVVNDVGKDGRIGIIIGGIPRLLFTIVPNGTGGYKNLVVNEIVNSVVGTYSIMQQVGDSVVWYV